MELLTTKDLTLQSVVDRVRRAVVVDDDILARDKATPSVFSVEAFEKALQEEKSKRMEEMRQKRRQSKGAASGALGVFFLLQCGRSGSKTQQGILVNI